MQPHYVCAFRMRMKRAGYKDIKIRCVDGDYIVSARDPVFGHLCFGFLTTYQFCNLLR